MSPLLLEAVERVLPVAVFLVAITAMAELADRAGVFDVAGHAVARFGSGRTWQVWLLFCALSVLCTVFLSLDTTAVLLTPVALAVATQIGVAPRLFALTTLWIANTGSLLLPVSNLSNLLAFMTFEDMGLDHDGYLRLALVPGATSIVVTVVVLAALHRTQLGRTYEVAPPAEPHDPVLLWLAGAVSLAVGPCFAMAMPPWAVAGVAALVLGAGFAWRDRSALRGLQLPWAMTVGFTVLTLAVTWAHGAGLLDSLTALAGTGTTTGELLRLAGLGAVSANAVNNLPAYLALEPAAGSPERLMALLVGVNAGPLVTPWASLATLLWLQRCRARGLDWRPWRLALGGALCAVLAVTVATWALAAAR